MQRILTVSALTAVLAMTAVSASAADKDGIYVTVGATFLSTELDLTDLDVQGQVIDLGTEDVDVAVINGRVGYRFNDFIAVEGEVGFGLGGDDFDRLIPVDVLGTTTNIDANINLDINNYYIGFIRGIYPVSDQFDIFARVGYGEATAEADVVGSALGFTAAASQDADENGFAYGVGGQFNLTNKDGIRADYTRLDETDIISIAYSRRF